MNFRFSEKALQKLSISSLDAEKIKNSHRKIGRGKREAWRSHG